MAIKSSDFNIAIDTAAEATAALRPAIEALEAIANIQAMCPLAAKIAVDGLLEIKQVLCTEKAVDHYERQLDAALAGASMDRLEGALVSHAQGGLVSPECLEAATERPSAIARFDAEIASTQAMDRRLRS